MEKARVVIASIIFGLIIIGYLIPNTPTDNTPTDSDISIWARECVRLELKTPHTAVFDINRETVRRADDSTFTITGTVDTHNGYGAMIHATYTTTVKHYPSRDVYGCGFTHVW